MKNNYFKTNGDLDISTENDCLYIVDSGCNECCYSEDEAKFMCRCLDDIFNKDRVFIYNDSQLRRFYNEFDIADIIRQKIEAQLEEHMLPMDGNMEFEIFGDLIKVTYRWSE